MIKRSGDMCSGGRAARAFTLVELLIVTGILAMVTVSALALATSMQARARDMHEHSHEAEFIGRTLDRWRSDIELADGIRPLPHGGCELTSGAGQGPARVIRYALNGVRFKRTGPDGVESLVADNVKGAEIAQEDGTWRLVITTASGDGPERIERAYQARASQIQWPAMETRP